ncbi:hypothetical protein X975_12646, partial [Stegodyphus mimosarum]
MIFVMLIMVIAYVMKDLKVGVVTSAVLGIMNFLLVINVSVSMMELNPHSVLLKASVSVITLAIVPVRKMSEVLNVMFASKEHLVWQ